MVDHHLSDEAGTTSVSDAFVAARELLQQAEEDAARLRVEADRYARQREQEAELLVATARRLLEGAAGRAAAIDAAAARAEVLQPPRHLRIDLDAAASTPQEMAGARSSRGGSDLASMLGDAISKAVDHCIATGC